MNKFTLTVNYKDSKKFNVILGIDGAGKTTLIDSLLKKKKNLKIIDWKTNESKTRFFQFDYASMGDRLHQLKIKSRTSLLAYLLALELEESIEKAIQNKDEFLVDSYWYKIYARELVGKTSMPILYDFLKVFPSPHKVIFLDTPPEVAFQRKTSFTPVETIVDKSDFVGFQTKVRKTLISLLEKENLEVVFLDGENEVEVNSAILNKEIYGKI